jgi:signal transduction histidine kinase
MARIKVRARAVDMLGRQQIAGIPTAIHELFKNAHDAYADHVEIDYFRGNQILVLRDDGFGMSREDFETRWLTLGTESKVGANDGSAEIGLPIAGTRRAIMGEKGIGRLAIAAIGPQVVVLSRAKKGDTLMPLVVCVINWRLFELPGIDIDSIDIPIEEVPSGSLPDVATMGRLLDRLRANVEALSPEIPVPFKARILEDISLAKYDFSAVYGSLKGLALTGDGHGTHFFIRPTTPILSDDIDGSRDDLASPLEKMLLGFSNTMMPGRPKPVISAEFRDHLEDGRINELISGEAFFTPEEFESADHHIEGEFDEYGQFRGTVGVYRQQPQQHVIHWPAATGRKTECGAFRIKFAYLQGRASETQVPLDEWARLGAKLNRIGGLYVYRDGIRILPYGNSDYDFLNIERRRTKSAQDWFFSYRRIFGAVEISHANNAELVEKAGREGFRSNRAYREFAAMLENFFERLAIDFFRPTSQFGEDFNAVKSELQREAEALKRREKFTKKRRSDFAGQLQEFFRRVESGEPAIEAESLRSELESRVSMLLRSGEGAHAAQALLDIENEFRRRAQDFYARYLVIKPRSVGLSRSLRADWAAYQRNEEKLRQEVFSELDQAVDDIVSAAGVEVALDRRRRVQSSLDVRRAQALQVAGRLRRQVQERAGQLQSAVEASVRTCINQFSNRIEGVFADSILELQVRWEQEIGLASKDATELLEAVRDQLQSVAAAVTNNEMLDETTAALESSAETLRDELESYAELAQVGMALGIVQHEFAHSVKQIRSSIRKLKPWADGTPALGSIYEGLKSNFDHLDTYLGLFTPMSRRLNRASVDLSGAEIAVYLDEVFGDRLSRHGIELVATPAFNENAVHCYASTVLPVFVNLVDNAIYWVSGRRNGPKVITLDADNGAFIVRNSGPGIPLRIAEQIFEFGHSAKPGGRGMGLYLSRQVLTKAGGSLSLLAAGERVEPAFRIDVGSA